VGKMDQKEQKVNLVIKIIKVNLVIREVEDSQVKCSGIVAQCVYQHGR